MKVITFANLRKTAPRGLFKVNLPIRQAQVSLLNPVVYLISGFRWSFYEHSDVSPATSVVMIVVFTVAALGIIAWMFKSGYRLRK